MSHLEGITVLNQYQPTKFPALAFLIVGVFCAAFVALAVFSWIKQWPTWAKITLTSIAGILLIFLGLFCLGVFNIKTEPVFECLVSEDVSYTEFTELYEIVDQRGQIFILKFRK